MATEEKILLVTHTRKIIEVSFQGELTELSTLSPSISTSNLNASFGAFNRAFIIPDNRLVEITNIRTGANRSIGTLSIPDNENIVAATSVDDPVSGESVYIITNKTDVTNAASVLWKITSVDRAIIEKVGNLYRDERGSTATFPVRVSAAFSVNRKLYLIGSSLNGSGFLWSVNTKTADVRVKSYFYDRSSDATIPTATGLDNRAFYVLLAGETDFVSWRELTDPEHENEDSVPPDTKSVSPANRT